MSAPHPIEIIGGGLAGLSLGLGLRHAGVPVTIAEAGHYPRHRVCGEFITGLADDTIAALGLGPVLAGALTHHEVAWFVGARPLRRDRLPAPARALSRHALDARLAAAFVAAGGQLRTGTRQADLAPRPGRVLATGRPRATSPWLGLKLHARNFALACDLELHLGDDAYVGLTQVEGGCVNLCGLFRRRPLHATGPALLAAYLHAARLPDLAARLEAAVPDPASVCAVAALGFDARPRAGPGPLLGDAGAVIAPFTGHGMAMAFQAAALALAPLTAYARGACAWPEAHHQLAAALRRRFRWRLAAAGWLHPFLLRPARQRWLQRLARAHLLPFRPLYAALH